MVVFFYDSLLMILAVYFVDQPFSVSVLSGSYTSSTSSVSLSIQSSLSIKNMYSPRLLSIPALRAEESPLFFLLMTETLESACS